MATTDRAYYIVGWRPEYVELLSHRRDITPIGGKIERWCFSAGASD